MEEAKNNSFFKQANAVGLFLVSLFLICFAWYYIRPAEQDLHQKLFKLTFLGFSGMNAVSFIFGALQSYLWAFAGFGLWKIFKR